MPERGNVLDGEALLLEPCGERGDVTVRGAEVLPELGGGQPLVIHRRVAILQLIEEYSRRSLLLGRAPQHENHMLGGGAVSNGTLIKTSLRQRMNVALKGRDL